MLKLVGTGMELYASEDINDIQNQNKAIKQVTNLNKTNCGPFVHTKSTKQLNIQESNTRKNQI